MPGEASMTEHAAPLTAKALIMLVSRLDTLEVAVDTLAPETVGVITSQNILKQVVLKCAELEERGTTFEYSLVDSVMEIGHAFERFVYLLDGFRERGYEPGEIMLDATGGS